MTPHSGNGTNPFNPANNRLVGRGYDARGDVTTLGGVTMAYDAEGNQSGTVDTKMNQTVTTSYVFDAEGQRVEQQISGGATIVDVRDAFGRMAAEYNSAGVRPACTTCYLVYDGVGSVRLVTDQSGNIVARHDYLPFGEEIASGVAGRSGNGSNFGYATNIAQGFTGQEGDGGLATLDYFNARHMAAAVGGFMQPDPGNAGADLANPQSWNAYGYVLGNPLGLVDPSGLHWEVTGTCLSYSTSSSSSSCSYNWSWVDDGPTVISTGGSIPPGGGGGGGGGQTQGKPPKDDVPDNVCQFAGNAPDPSFWALAGKASKWDPVSAVLDLTKGFKIGGYLDAQPMASGDPHQRAAYGNYLFGAWMRASGTPLPVALAGANEIAFLHKLSNPNQYRGRQMDSFFWSLPAAEVANIVNGYSAQKNGTLCHK